MDWLPRASYALGVLDRLADDGYIPFATGNAYTEREHEVTLPSEHRGSGEMVFHYTWKGSCLFHDYARGRTQTVAEGQAFICQFPSQTCYEKTTDTDWGMLWFIIHGQRAQNIFNTLINDADSHVFDCPADSWVIRTLVKIFQARHRGPLPPHIAAGLAYEFMMAVAHLSEPVMPNVILTAMDYIAKHLGDPDLDVAAIAQSVGKSRAHFSREFKRHSGYSIVQYVHRRRMDRAVELILERKHKMKEIAELLGFNEASYFNAVFKKHFGYAPSQL